MFPGEESASDKKSTVWKGILDLPINAPPFATEHLRGFERSPHLINIAWTKAREMAKKNDDCVYQQKGELQGKWRGRRHGEPVIEASSTITGRSADGFHWVLIQSHVQVPHESSGERICFSVTRTAEPVVLGVEPEFMHEGGGSELLEE